MTCYDILTLQWSCIGADKCTVVNNGLFKSAFTDSPSADCCPRLTPHPALLRYKAVRRWPSLMDFMHHLNVSHMSNTLIFPTLPWVRKYVLSQVCTLCRCSSTFTAGVNRHTLRHYLRTGSFVCVSDLGIRGTRGDEPQSVWGSFF